ncbi:hypothetical protein COU17_00095 [Candidatus Kaiserbacteria bacterium CG10_big_fil_rev_8_21_14_0_10_49_17]|uniref:Uncharacterized protein n=1 Tax=Candidatus Kaiserbacteria bacterium CG10_big_fil_rev_8_21_14_0_10_49_17 TaxID=1974609 RepID=A0A2M6WFD3_9BACT|nr:MAG: hypothetical protein COU17_00095 [Candidatus Kaiserbacteria bacterium CG10_big_fil_rev_8_21_14_0_10_49_17]
MAGLERFVKGDLEEGAALHQKGDSAPTWKEEEKRIGINRAKELHSGDIDINFLELREAIEAISTLDELVALLREYAQEPQKYPFEEEPEDIIERIMIYRLQPNEVHLQQLTQMGGLREKVAEILAPQQLQ